MAGRTLADMSGEPKGRRSARARWIEYAILITVAVVAAVGVRTFLLQTFYIPSESMEQTLLVDDKVLVNKVIYKIRDPRRGEVVVFKPPPQWAAGPGHDDYIKRIVGLGGDRIVCCDQGGRLTVNGRVLDETYLYPGDEPSTMPFDVTVPENHVFVMGDHRSASADSRVHLQFQDGAVSVDRLVGRAFVTFWPANRMRSLSPPEAFAGIPDPR